MRGGRGFGWEGAGVGKWGGVEESVGERQATRGAEVQGRSV